MLTRQRLIWFVLTAIPLISVLWMWISTAGLPYNTDSNESFSAYVQGQNMLRFNPWVNAFLPDDATANHAGAHPFTYTHGPNLPRYFSAAMSLLGLQGLETQILIAAIIATLLSFWFIAKGFPETVAGGPTRLEISLGMLIAALFATDFIGVLQYLGNLWRTWHFPLFWGCIWAVRTRPHWMAGFILFFLLFQLEFLFALFYRCNRIRLCALVAPRGVAVNPQQQLYRYFIRSRSFSPVLHLPTRCFLRLARISVRSEDYIRGT